MYGYTRKTGQADGWNIAYYVFTFFRGLLFFAVAVLVGTGWSYMKPFLADREKKILMVVIPLQIFSNMAIIILDETTPASKNWFTWRDIFHLVRDAELGCQSPLCAGGRPQRSADGRGARRCPG